MGGRAAFVTPTLGLGLAGAIGFYGSPTAPRANIPPIPAEIVGEMEDWVTYDLPEHLIGVAFHGKYKGQKQKWFAMRFTGEDGDIDLTSHEPEFSAFQWVDLKALPGLIVPFKRDTYKAVIAALGKYA